MSECLVRQASLADASTVFRLIEALADYEKLAPPDDAARERLRGDLWGPRPRAEAWLAEVGGKAAAYAITFETYSTFLARPTLYLEDLFVLSQYRRQGVGKAMFQRLAREAVERGCGRLEWTCLEWNQLAQEFYEGLGAERLRTWISYRMDAARLSELAGAGK